MADPKLVARLNSGPCCWRGRELTEVRLLWTVCYWESLLMALLRPADQDREGRIIGLERPRLQWA